LWSSNPITITYYRISEKNKTRGIVSPAYLEIVATPLTLSLEERLQKNYSPPLRGGVRGG